MSQARQSMQLLRTNLTCAAWGLLIASVCGCAGGQWSEKADWLAFWKPEKGMDVRTRADQLKDLRELAKQVPSASASEQERASLEIAQSIRNETDPIVRAQMMRTIGVCKSHVADKVAAAGISDSDSRVRVASCEALGVRGGPEQVRLLGGALSGDTDIDVRLAAARALGESKDPAAAQALAPALDDPNPALQVRTMRSLEKVAKQDFGNDVAAWRQYVRGETPQPRTQSIASRFRQLW
jgi:HEAT repeat protein